MTFKQWGNLSIRVGACLFLLGLEAYATGREAVRKLRRPSPSRAGSAKVAPVVKAESVARHQVGAALN